MLALSAETGKAPARTTYARWESGASRPEPTSLRPIIAFYEARGLAGPGQQQPAAPEQAAPDLPSAIMALVSELAAAREERAAMRAEMDALKALVGVLAGERLSSPAPAAQAAHAAPGR